MQLPRGYLLGVTCVSLLATGSARGDLLAFEFAGVIDSVDDQTNALGGSVQVGDAFAGSYTYNPMTEDSLPDDPEQGLYQSPDGSMSVPLGAFDFLAAGDDTRIWVLNRSVRDELRLEATDFAQGTLTVDYMVVGLVDPTATALSSDALPALPLQFELEDFQERGFVFAAVTADFHPLKVFGTVTSFVLVPEPQSIAILVLGIAVVLRRRRSKSTGAVWVP